MKCWCRGKMITKISPTGTSIVSPLHFLFAKVAASMAAAGRLQDRSHALQAWMWLCNKNPHTHTSSVKTCLLWLRILNFITTMIQLEIFSRWLYTVFAWNIRSPYRSGLTLPMLSTSYQLFKVGEGGASNVRETKDTAYCIPLKRATCGTMLHSQVVQNTTQPMRRLELQAPTGLGHTNISPCLSSLGLQESRWRLVLAGPAFRAPIILEPFKAIPRSCSCRTMALAWTLYFSAFAHSPAQAAVVVRQEQSTKSFAVSSAMICGSEAGGQNIEESKGVAV